MAGKHSRRLLFGSKYKTRSSVLCAGILPSARLSSALSNNVFIFPLEVGFLPFLDPSTPAMLPVFLRSFCKCSNALLGLSESGVGKTEKGLLSGSERSKQSMATPRWISLVNFCKNSVFLHLFYRFQKFCDTKTSKAFSNMKGKIILT